MMQSILLVVIISIQTITIAYLLYQVGDLKIHIEFHDKYLQAVDKLIKDAGDIIKKTLEERNAKD